MGARAPTVPTVTRPLIITQKNCSWTPFAQNLISITSQFSLRSLAHLQIFAFNHWTYHKKDTMSMVSYIYKLSGNHQCMQAYQMLLFRWGSKKFMNSLTSIIFLSLVVFFPLQVLHLWASLTISPLASHLSQGLCICCIMPGPICLVMTFMPRPLQIEHFSTLLPPFPSHFPQATSRLIASFRSLPLYKSSRLTVSWERI